MRTPFVAEVSSNHHQDLSRCLEFVAAAARIGCSAVKFQLFKIDQLFAPEILAASEQHRNRRQWELPLAFIAPIAQACKDNNIQFCCTPFYLAAVQELQPFVDFYKIASYELLWDDLLIACAATKKPLVLSTGMATLEEIDHAVAVIRQAGCKDLTLLHCVSAYPTPVSACNLAAMATIKQRYACKTGWSDHSVSSAVVARAVQHWQADMIEFHLDLEGEGEEYASGHCWLPDAMKNLIDGLATDQAEAGIYANTDAATSKLALLADGRGVKHFAAEELADRDWRADPEDGLRPLKSVRQQTLEIAQE